MHELKRRGVALLAPRSSVLGHTPCGGSEVVLWEDVGILQAAGIPARVFGSAARPGAPVRAIPLRTAAPLVTSLEYGGTFARHARRALLLAYNEPAVAAIAPRRALIRFDWTTPLPRYWRLPGLLARFDRATYLFPSADQRRLFVEGHPGFPGSRLHVLPNGVDLHEFRPAARSSDLTVRIGFAGQFSPEKGLGVLLDAWTRLARPESAIELWLAGGESLWKRSTPSPGAEALAARLAQACAADPRIRLAGELPRSGMPAFWNSMDIAVVPSLRESFGLQALEAMACGIPVVASRVGGLAELVSEGESGLFVSPGDPHAAADALARMIAEPELRLALGAGARRRAETYSLERRAEQFLALLERVAEPPEAVTT